MVIMTTQVYCNYHNHHHHHHNYLPSHLGNLDVPGVLHRRQRSRQADDGEASRDTLPCLGEDTQPHLEKKHLVKVNIQPPLANMSKEENYIFWKEE